MISTVDEPAASGPQEKTLLETDTETKTATAAETASTSSTDPSLPRLKLRRFSYEWVLEARGSMFMIVLSMSFAVFTDIFVYAVIVPVIPYVLESRLGVAEDRAQANVSKILALYSAGLIVGSVVFGYLADRLHHRRLIMLAGLAVLVGATLILFFAKGMALYMVGRVVQGISAAVVWVVGLAIIADVGDSSNIAYLMSFPGIGLSMGMFLGPLVGGIVYERAGYNAVFYVCFGVLAIDIALRLIMLEKSHMEAIRAEHVEKLHSAGVESLSPTLQEYVRRHLPDNTPEGEEETPDASKFRFYMPVWKGRRVQIPAYLALLGNARILNACFLSIVMAWIITAFEGILTLRVESVFHFSALQSGLLILAFAGPSLLEPVVGYLSDRVGPRNIVFLGLLVATPALVLMRLPQRNAAGDIAGLSVLLVIVGFCVSAIFAPVTGEFSNAVSKVEARRPGCLGKGRGFGQVYGLFNVAYALGSLIGPFEAGGIVDSHGWGAAVLSLGVVTFVAAFVTYPFTGGNLVARWLKKRRAVRAAQDPEAGDALE